MMRIKIAGVGGGGSAIIDRMMEEPLTDVEYISINTDIQVLGNSKAPVKLQIGADLTNGFGAGGSMEIGCKAAYLDRQNIAKVIDNCDLLVLVVSLGRGTGTGAAPVIADIARENGIMTAAVVTTPFRFEGTTQAEQATKGIELMRNSVSLLLLAPNGGFTKYIDSKSITMNDSFALTDAALIQLVETVVGFAQQTNIKQSRDKETKRGWFKWLPKVKKHFKKH